MEVGNNIYNPAAVVESSGSRTSSSRGYGGSYTSNKSDDSSRSSGGSEAPKPENRTISNLSRARAAAGNPNLSTETQEAIKNGALPPTVAEAKTKPTTPEKISDVAIQLASTGSIKSSLAPESASNLGSSGASAPIGSIVNILV